MTASKLSFNRATLATIMLVMVDLARGEALPVASLPNVQPVGEYIVLDNSSEQELVISNNEMTATENGSVRLAQTQPTGWKKDPMPYQAEVQAAAQATHIDAALIHAVIATESGYNPRALSRKGAYGLMQVLPATAQTLSAIPIKQWSVPQQILWGSHYLKRMLDMFEGNVILALAAYNAGPQAVKAHQQAVPPYAETRQYIPKVLGYYQTFKARLPQISE